MPLRTFFSNQPTSLLFRRRVLLSFSHPTPIRTSHYSNEARPRPTRVLITGGSRGIGFAIAAAFVKADNFSIQLISRNATLLHEAITALQGFHKAKTPTCTQASLDALIQGTQADVSNPSTWDNSFTSKKWLVPDILINSAGISHSSLLMAMKTRSALSNGDGDVERIINTNLMGTIYACRAASKAMLRGKKKDPSPKHSPCIINISSLLATHGGRGTSVYSASKAGVLGIYHGPNHIIQVLKASNRSHASTCCRIRTKRHQSQRHSTWLHRDINDEWFVVHSSILLLYSYMQTLYPSSLAAQFQHRHSRLKYEVRIEANIHVLP